MLERGRGAVVITGSVAGMQPLPLHGVYAATKAFDRFFGEALFVELRDQGIDVIVLEPGTVETEFQAGGRRAGAPGRDAGAASSSSRCARSAASPPWCRAGGTGCAGTLAMRLGAARAGRLRRPAT